MCCCFDQFGCDVNAQDSDGWTTLWHAYSNSNVDIMRLLLKSGADKNVPNIDGRTILDEAKLSEDEDMIDILQRFGQSWTWFSNSVTCVNRPLYNSDTSGNQGFLVANSYNFYIWNKTISVWKSCPSRQFSLCLVWTGLIFE